MHPRLAGHTNTMPSPSLLPNTWVAFTLPVLVTLASAEVGFRLGLRTHRARDEQRKANIGGVQGAILGLLGLLLGFTFALSTARYEARRALVLQEANAIGTTYLRASLLPEAHVAPVQELLREYVRLRVEFYRKFTEPAVFREALARSAEIQRRLWQHAVEAAREAPTPITATFVTTLNETIDSEAARVTEAAAHIPSAVWVLVLVVASLGCFTTSYLSGAEGARSAFSSVELPMMIAVVMVLIFDIANPHKGFIGISQQPMIDLQSSIAAPAPPR